MTCAAKHLRPLTSHVPGIQASHPWAVADKHYWCSAMAVVHVRPCPLPPGPLDQHSWPWLGDTRESVRCARRAGGWMLRQSHVLHVVMSMSCQFYTVASLLMLMYYLSNMLMTSPIKKRKNNNNYKYKNIHLNVIHLQELFTSSLLTAMITVMFF